MGIMFSDYIKDPYYEGCCCELCGERISFEAYEDNDGLCDECFIYQQEEDLRD